MLLIIWGEANIQKELDRFAKNKSIFEEIAKCLHLWESFETATRCRVLLRVSVVHSKVNKEQR